MLVEVNENVSSPAVLKVIGLGGAGGNAVNRMLESDIRGVEFLVANTDLQALNASTCPNGIQLGAQVTGGLGSGGNAEVGRRAAEEDVDTIRERLEGADMVFITAGMGGGTGTGASAIVAQVARELGALTVGIVTKPFAFEGRRRMRQADEGLAELRQYVDTLIIIPNQRLLHVVDRTTPLNEALRVADDVLSHATKGISEIITVPGLINVDFADVRTVMTGMGNALMGMGFGQGADRAQEASQMAVASPLLEDISITGARGVLVNFMGGPDMTLAEVDEASNQIMEAAGEDANVIFGAVIDPRMKDEIRVTLIATGFGVPAERSAEGFGERAADGFAQEAVHSSAGRSELEADRFLREEMRGSAPPLMPKDSSGGKTAERARDTVPRSSAESSHPAPMPHHVSGAGAEPREYPLQRRPLTGTDPAHGSPALNQQRDEATVSGSEARPGVRTGVRTGARTGARTAAGSDVQPRMQAGSHPQTESDTRPESSPERRWQAPHRREYQESASYASASDPMMSDGVVGKARPIRRSGSDLSASRMMPATPSETVHDPGAATAPEEVPQNVVPLVWKKNLSGRQWSPTMSSKWQRVLRRDQLDVPSFLRRRQVD